jgi:uncharacterized membrane protein (DUF4010 family)
MVIGAACALALRAKRIHEDSQTETPASPPDSADAVAPTLLSALQSPFSLTAALQFGGIFLALEIAGTLGQRLLGQLGFYAVSVIGGAVSSASAVASAANLAIAATLTPQTAATGAVIASAMSALVNLPLVARLADDRALTHRIAWALGAIVILGAAGAAFQTL